MDSTLNDFLNEINEIAPLKTAKKEFGWKKCFDEKSGFSYYWNTITDEVTWEEPKCFKSSRSNIHSKAPPAHPASIPELFDKVKDTVKIYKLSSNCNTPIPPKIPKGGMASKSESVKIPPKKFKTGSDSDDEKITLITSYGSESESEGEEENDDLPSESSRTSSRKKSFSDDEENDILSTVRKRAEELKKFGQADIKNIIIKAEETNPDPKPSKQKSLISGFSLVAGYDSNSEEEEAEESKPKEIIDQPTEKQMNYSHSTLFPIVKPPDVNDFIETREVTVEPSPNITSEKSFVSKNFQRKRRLGVNFVPTQKNSLNLPPSVPPDGERKGLGFNTTSSNSNNTAKSSNSFYSNFTSGGVEFAKPDTLEGSNSKEIEVDDTDMQQISKIYEVLHEKLAFLCEGNMDVMPVQIILIQIETLFGALKAKCLKSSYLHEWLENTNEDLIKLEKEAAPEGWLLQWDRSRKRYYYHNQSTGEGRWEYPLPDVQQEEAMDISTTPPPPEAEQEQPVVVEQPPLPPSPPCESPSPPPPPIISRPDPQPIPEPPSAPKISLVPNDQPPPPGVDFAESAEFKSKTQPPETIVNDIDSAFDTFYSELATIESTSNAPSPSNIIEQPLKTDDIVQESELIEPPKKKKKKMKMGQGLSLKKKDVSKLVEKWKNVQKNY